MAETTTDTTQRQRTCFVVMGFGKKTDFETGRTLDLDKSYLNMIKPAVEAAGLKCIRADEIVHSGLIDVPMYEQLLHADVVVADLSTSNKNAFYELGIRHALRPATTIIVAEDGIKAFPFDVNHVAVRQYHHLGEDIGYGEVVRFQTMLTQAIKEIEAANGLNPDNHDSPVYTFLHNLIPPSLRQLQAAAAAAVAAVVEKLTPAAEATAAAEVADKTHRMLMSEVDAAQQAGDWLQMKSLLEVIRRMQAQARPAAAPAGAALAPPPGAEDPSLLQRLALATYKSATPTEAEALQAARELLRPLNPATTNDTETLGLWGTIHKHRWNLAQRTGPGGEAPSAAAVADLEEAVRAYERGFHLRNDYYNGINLAFMLNVRAAATQNPAEAIADFVQAQRVRREVIQLCDEWLAANPAADADAAAAPGTAAHRCAVARHWVLATKAEAYLGLGQADEAARLGQEAAAIAPEPWMAETADEQLAALQKLLVRNPLQFIAAA